MSNHIIHDDRMAAVLADAMNLPEVQRIELSRWLSNLVSAGVSLDPESVRASGSNGVRALFQRAA
jgi:hypothetical protein